MKDHAKYSQLIWKALRNQLDPAEEEELRRARLTHDADLQRVDRETEKLWQLTQHYGRSFEPDADAALEKLRRKLPSQAPRRRYRPLSWLALAASLAFLVVVGRQWLREASGNDREVATAAGEIKTVRLPDGSEVVLNEESRLFYPADLGRGGERSVRFVGEGYFQVEADAAHPFIIETGTAVVRVVGTKFNLRAYAREAFTEVEVETGRVHLRDLEDRHALTLDRGQVGILGKTSAPRVDTVTSFNRQAWLTHKMNFKNVPVIQMIPLLERYYDITLDHPPLEKFNCPLTANWENMPLNNTLEALQSLTNMEVRRLGGRHYRLEGSCKR